VAKFAGAIGPAATWNCAQPSKERHSPCRVMDAGRLGRVAPPRKTDGETCETVIIRPIPPQLRISLQDADCAGERDSARVPGNLLETSGSVNPRWRTRSDDAIRREGSEGETRMSSRCVRQSRDDNRVAGKSGTSDLDESRDLRTSQERRSRTRRQTRRV